MRTQFLSFPANGPNHMESVVSANDYTRVTHEFLVEILVLETVDQFFKTFQ
jgi:hypothetical protein